MRELDRPLAKRDQILQRVLGSLSLFDAVPFLAFPHFVAPRPFCVIGPQKGEKKQSKGIVSLIVSEC
jgi:hypothetical protein